VAVFTEEEDAGWNVAAICCLADGTLLAHANRWRYLDNGRIDRLHGRSEIDGVWLSRSTDKGRTWSAPSRVNLAPMRNARVRDGRLLGMMRTQRWPSPADPGEQMGPPSGYIYTALSEDDGMSWSWPRTTKLWGYPPDAITLEDGAVLAAYSYRTKPMGVRIAV